MESQEKEKETSRCSESNNSNKINTNHNAMNIKNVFEIDKNSIIITKLINELH